MNRIQSKKMSPLKNLKNTQVFFRNFIEESPLTPFYPKSNHSSSNPYSSIQTQKRIQEEKKKKINSFFKPLKKINLKNAQKIYRRNYLETLKNALEDTFPVSSYFLNDQNFKKLAFQYILKNKARSPFFSDYGKKFPNFIRKSIFHPSFPFLADLAFFEWQFKELTLTPFETPVLNQEKHSIKNLLYSPSDSILNKNSKPIKKTVQYLKLSGDRALFKISSKVQLFSSSFPVIDLWKTFTYEMKSNKKDKLEEKNHFEPQMMKMMRLKKDQKTFSQKKLKMKDKKKEFFILIKKDFENKVLVEKINFYDYFILESFLDFCSISKVKNRILKRFLIQSKENIKKDSRKNSLKRKTTTEKNEEKNSKELLIQKRDLISSYGKSLNHLIKSGFLVHKEF